ncbi:hypothetical protein RchiOBHm_Chr1g0316771 [Rosa chinensis]|uniref:Uncharacterized protein n=1 Tax=Rosa chinensis TaxID=74649 RepID=A0A2P6S7Q5_ROSCH|nr:hypothetical protein RchiOBHm_Chr1g0316771 [Rosa chinensis]
MSLRFRFGFTEKPKLNKKCSYGAISMDIHEYLVVGRTPGWELKPSSWRLSTEFGTRSLGFGTGSG